MKQSLDSTTDAKVGADVSHFCVISDIEKSEPEMSLISHSYFILIRAKGRHLFSALNKGEFCKIQSAVFS